MNDLNARIDEYLLSCLEVEVHNRKWGVLYSAPSHSELRPCGSESEARSFALRFATEGYAEFKWCYVIAYRVASATVCRPENVPYDFS